MKFCQLCQGLMKIENKRYACSCGNFEYINNPNQMIEKNLFKNKETTVLESDINPLATIDHVCSVCGFDKAQLVSRGITYSDEDEMVEYVCGKCGHHDVPDGLRAG